MKLDSTTPDVEKGDVLAYRTRKGEQGSGVLWLVWWCLDELCYEVVRIDGEKVSLFPGFGDTFTKASEPESEHAK